MAAEPQLAIGPMRVSLCVIPASLTPMATPQLLAELAARAEAEGFSNLWVGEHVVWFDRYQSRYPYTEDGVMPAAPTEFGLLEEFTLLGYLAAATSRIRLGTSICLLAQRNPVLTALAASSVDWLSAGRLDLGIGLGWAREEFEALNVPWERRGQRTREYLEVMRALWREDEAAFEGETYSLPPCRFNPKPVQEPSPPIYFGGEGDPALRRVAELGDGWLGWMVGPERAGERVARLGELLAERGRSLAEIDVVVAPTMAPPEPWLFEARTLSTYAEAGVGHLVLFAPPFGSPAEAVEYVERLAERVRAAPAPG